VTPVLTSNHDLVYREMTIGWAASLLGFIAIALGPVPWALYRWGPQIRAKSKYEQAYQEDIRVLS